MGKIHLALDFEKLLGVAQSLPQILSQIPGGAPKGIAQYAPLISKGAEMLQQFASVSDGAAGMPAMEHLGPPGEGFAKYQRTSSQWTDEEVARAADALMFDEGAPPVVLQMRGAVEFALSMMGESMEGKVLPSFDKMRSAVDKVLQGTALPSAVRDRMGDALFFTLKARKK